MKKLFFLILISTSVYAQQNATLDYLTRKTYPQSYSSFSLISGRSYSASRLDTTIAYPCADWKSFYVTVQSKDSASCIIRYQISADSGGVSTMSWSASAIKDSLSTTNNAGDVKSADVSGQVLGAKWVRFIFDFTSGATQGSTTNTYSATLKRYPY